MKNRTTWIYLLPFAGFFVLVAFLGFGLNQDPTLLPSALIGQPLPTFSLLSLDAPQKQITDKDLHGKAALINVWATWCPSCRAEHATLNKLAKQGVIIFGVNYKDSLPDARRWLAQLGNPYALNLFDETGQLGIDLGVYGAPETYVLVDGIIRYRHVGPVTEEAWQEILQPKLAAFSKD